jgi:hypothetical protein
MLHPALRHYVFVHRFVEAVTWQPLRQALASRPSRPAIPSPQRLETSALVPSHRAA